MPVLILQYPLFFYQGCEVYTVAIKAHNILYVLMHSIDLIFVWIIQVSSS